MATNDRFHHNRIDNTALPYISNASITEQRPHWVQGSHDTLASIRGWTERRPGLSVYTADAFASTLTILRWFTWQRWDSSFFVMSSIVGGGQSFVFKQKVGTDATFVQIYTEATTTEPFDYVEANNFVFFGNGTDMKKYDGTTVTNWGINPQPTTAPTTSNAAAGNVPATIGHKYIYAYGVSATGYVSDVSDPSAVIATASRQWDVTGPKCTDTQCDKVHIYRTEDGGSVYLELSNSPIANPGGATWTIRDNDADTSLQQSFPAPFPGVNDKPPALKGLLFFAGRIWGFRGDTVYFSTFEENTTSVPEECFGQALTNSRSFGAQVMGLAKTPDFLLVFTTRGIYRISGDSLNTFNYSQLSANMGVRNRAAIAEFDDKVAWLDYSNTIQVTDGYSIAKDDISLPIRPDIESITHSTASLTVYSTGKYRWLVLGDGTAGKIWVFDIVMGQWNPYWAVAGLNSVGMGQIAAGTFRMFVGINNATNAYPLYINHADYQDRGSSFIAELYTNLAQINKDNPTAVSVLEYIGTELNAIALTDVKYLVDDDFTTGTYTSIFANETAPANRSNGTNLIEKWYWANTPAAQRVSGYLKWAAANTKFVLYTLDLIHRKVN